MDYEQLYKRVAQAIIKAEGKLGTDTRAFAEQLALKLRAEGWQDTPAVQALINDYLAAVDTTLKAALTTAIAASAGGLQSKAVLKLAGQAFAERWPDGLTLSERLWRWHKATRDGVQTQLQRGIRQGKATGSVVMAMQRAIERTHGGQRFKIISEHTDDWVQALHQSAQAMIHNPAAMADWQAVVDDVEARISTLSRTGTRNAAERLLDQIKTAVKKGNEALLDNAVKWWTYDQQLYHLKRIVRTEMATAAHRAVIASSMDGPDIIGFQWRLSASHTASDICDYYANIEMGLGKGVWTKEAVPHHKAHPHCMCLLIPRVTPINQKGSKNYAEFIQNTTKERRDQLLPAWAKGAVDGGVPLAKLVRPDGLGLVSKQAALPLLNTATVEKMVAKLAEKSKNASSLVDLWANPTAYKKHVDKRILLGHAENEVDYFDKTLVAMRGAKDFNVSGSQRFPVVELVNGDWSVILSHEGLIKTSYNYQPGMETFTEQQIRRGHKVYSYDIADIGKKLKGL